MTAESIVGRHDERERLGEILSSPEAEFVALYGRRRVGKTFLIREYFAGHTFLEVTGEKGQTAQLQIARFCHEVARVFFDARPLPAYPSWNAAFDLLCGAIEDHAKRNPRAPIIVFLDELPWLATHRSGLMGALDHAWNARLSKINTLRLIVCGCAAAWMLDKLVHAKGGLYNRITQRIELRPFSLAETATFLRARGVTLSHRQTMLLYMTIGGVPHYLKQVRRGQSVTQVVGNLCFGRSGALRDEFDSLFASLFSSADSHLAIVRTLASHSSGLSQEQLAARAGLSGGGSFKRYLDELEASGFIAKLSPFGHRKKDTLYRLTDEYSAFYLRWIDRAPSAALTGDGVKYWQGKANSAGYSAWAGYAFETMCFKHIDQLVDALGLSAIGLTPSTWRHVPKRQRTEGPRAAKGAQVDLLLDRDDDTITLCEMKHTERPFAVDRKYARELSEKLSVFEEVTRTRKNVELVMVCSAGLRKNQYSEDLVANAVSLDAFLAP